MRSGMSHDPTNRPRAADDVEAAVMEGEEHLGGSLRLIVYWAVVLVPLAYGVVNTILKSLPLF